MSLAAVGIISANPLKSVEFYQLLGVDLKKYGEHEHYEAVTSSGLRMMLDSEKLMKLLEPSWSKQNGNGVVLCFEQSSPENVNKLYQKFVTAGFHGIKPPWDAFWGQRYACVADPDGNQIDLFAAMTPIG